MGYHWLKCIINLVMDVVFKKDKNLSKKKRGLKCPNFLTNKDGHFYYFVITCLIGTLFFLVMLVNNNFTLSYSGDYASQYIPMFYHNWDVYHEFLRTGHFRLFDDAVYFGASTLGSDTYYGLFSPFNLILILFPRNWVPQVSGIISILKCGFGALFFAIYLQKSFKLKKFASQLAGIAYAFSGWMAFYLWYGNYLDMIVFFPLVLLGIELVLQKKKPWVLAIGVFFLSVCNYVLMTSLMLCAFLYAMFRYFQLLKTYRSTKNALIVLGLGIMGAITGLLLSSIIVIPAIMNTLTSPKLGTNAYVDKLKEALTQKDYLLFFKCIFSWKYAPDQHGNIYPWRGALPIIDFFFPTVSDRNAATIEAYSWDFDDNACSLWMYSPFIIFFVPALIEDIKRKKFSVIIPVIFFIFALFTPFMYLFFSLFTAAYARWSLFVCSSFIAYVAIYIDKLPNVNKKYIHFGYIFFLVGITLTAILTYVLVKKYSTLEDGASQTLHFRFAYYSYDKIDDNFTIIAFIVEVVLATAYYLLIMYFFNKKFFKSLLFTILSLEVFAVGTFVTFGHGYTTTYNNGFSENHELANVVSNIKKDDKDSYRIYTSFNDGWSDNNGLMNDYAGTSFFHSLYNFNTRNFIIWTGLGTNNSKKSVAQSYRGKIQEMEDLLGVKYYILEKDRLELFDDNTKLPTNSDIYTLFNNADEYQYNVPLHYELDTYKSTDRFLVFKNTSFASIGVGYDSYYCLNSKEDETISDRPIYSDTMHFVRLSALMKKTVLVDYTVQEQIDNNSSIGQFEGSTSTSISLTTLNLKYQYCPVPDGYSAINYPLDKAVNLLSQTDEGDILSNLSYNTGNKYIGFITMKSGANFPEDENGLALYIPISMSDSRKYRFYFLDENNKIFMFDNHDDHHTATGTGIRGFYLKNTSTHKLKTIMIVGRYPNSSERPSIYYQLGTSYETDYKAYTQYALENTNYKQDYITFTSNYASQKLVVTRLPYDKGWLLYAKKDGESKFNKLYTFNGNGGFTSFIADEGNYSYILKYEPPYINIGSLLTGLGIITFFTSLIGYQYMVEDKFYKTWYKI